MTFTPQKDFAHGTPVKMHEKVLLLKGKIIFYQTVDISLISKYTVAMKMDNTIFLIGRINEKSNKYLTQEMGKIGLTGLAPSHGDVIANLFKYKEISMSQLSSVIHRDPSTVTILVNKLKRLGLVQTRKDENDSRITFVFLTNEGKKLEPHFNKISRKLYRKEYQGITDEEREILQTLLEKVNENF